MKRSLLVCALVFIGSICTTSAIAQIQYEYEGHGMSNIKAQRETNPEIIKRNFRKVVFGSTQEAFTVIRKDLKHVSQQQILDGITQNISDQMGEEFFPYRPDEYTIEWETMYMNSKEWREFCEQNEDSYIRDQVGELIFDYGDPSSSYASKNKTCRIIATITHKTTGKQARLFADCLNGFRPVQETVTKVIDRQPSQLPPVTITTDCTIQSFSANPTTIFTKKGEIKSRLDWNTTCPNPIITSPDYAFKIRVQSVGNTEVYPPLTPPANGNKFWKVRYLLSINSGGMTREVVVNVDTRTWFGRNKAIWIPIAIGLGGAIIYEVFHMVHHGTSYDVGWVHDSNTSPWTSGGSGTGPTI